MTALMTFLFPRNLPSSRRGAEPGEDDKLKELISTLPVPMLLVRRSDGTVLYANALVRHLAGAQKAGTLEFFLDGPGSPFGPEGTGESALNEVHYRTGDGTVRTTFLNSRPVVFEGQPALVVVMLDVTRRREAEAELQRKNKVLSALNELQDRFVSTPDSKTMFKRWLNAALELTESTTGSIVQVNCCAADRVHVLAAVDSGTAAQPHALAIPLYAGDALTGVLELAGRTSAFERTLLDELAPFFNSCGTLIDAYCGTRQREEAEKLLSKLSMAVEQSPTAVIITDSGGTIEYVNRRFSDITGYAWDEAIGQTPALLKSGYMPATAYREMWHTLLSGQDWRGELYNKRKDDEYYWSRTHISPIKGKDGQVTHLVAVAEDITTRKRYEERLLHQANFDQLTGLPNRVLAFDRLCQVLNQAQRHRRPLTVMQVDIDHFKTVNDSLGHAVGDAVLVESARRLELCVRKTDTVARLGSDEFLVILADRSAEDPADVVARRILDSFNRPFKVIGNELFLSVSIGLTVAPDDGTQPQTLLQNCGVAMGRAKEIGPNTYHFFTPGMNQEAADRLEIDAHLRHALVRQELVLNYQPLLDLNTGRMAGAEALLRWDSAALGLVMPDRFIPLAEDTGLIVSIGDWVLNAACQTAKEWADRGMDIIMAVNTSSRQLRQPRFLDDVADALERSGLDPHRLELEITESFLIEDPDRTGNVLHELTKLGVRLSLDDFGTGYSSLSYLKRYPFHTLKIDRSFIRDVLTDPSDRALVRAIIAMARSLKLRVVAEGVETEEQMNFLRDQDCDAIQGYHYSRPLALAAVETFMKV